MLHFCRIILIIILLIKIKYIQAFEGSSNSGLTDISGIFGNLNVGYTSENSLTQVNTMLFNNNDFYLNFETDNSNNKVSIESFF